MFISIQGGIFVHKKGKISLRGLTAGAMMAALSIILERVLAIMPASNMMDVRVSLSNIPIIHWRKNTVVLHIILKPHQRQFMKCSGSADLMRSERTGSCVKE